MVNKSATDLKGPLNVALAHPEVSRRFDPAIAGALGGVRLIDYGIGVLVDTLAHLSEGHPARAEVQGLVKAVQESSDYRAFFQRSGLEDVTRHGKNPAYKSCNGF